MSRINMLWANRPALPEYVDQTLGPELVRRIHALAPDEIRAKTTEQITEELRPVFELSDPELQLPGELRDPEEFDREVVPGPGWSGRPGTRPLPEKVYRYTREIRFRGSLTGLSRPHSPAVEPMKDASAEIDTIYIRYETSRPTPQEIKAHFDDRIQRIQGVLEANKAITRPWNKEFVRLARESIESRRAKLEAASSVAQSLGIPLKRRSDSQAFAVPLKRKPLAVSPQEGRLTEPSLEVRAYEDALGVLKNVALAIERSPRAFASMEEEHLRDFSLLMLNAVFEGQATGETFNREGKTDILLRIRNTNIFVAEYKIWKGSSTIRQALKQLEERYLTWRDTKAAVIVFSRQADFGSVLDAIPTELRRASSFRKMLSEERSEARYRCTLVSPSDASSEVLLTVQAFHVQAAGSAGKASVKARRRRK